jgi:hypothetical protein
MKNSSNKATSAPELIAKILVITFYLILFTITQANAQVRYKLTTKLENFNAWAMNERGQVSGWGDDGFARIYSPGIGVIKLPRPDGVAGSNGYRLNEKGQVAGQLDYSSSYWGKTYEGFIYTPGSKAGMQLVDTRIGFGFALSEDGSPLKLVSELPTWAVPGTGAIMAVTQNGYTAGFSEFNSSNDYGMGWRLNPDGTFDKVGIKVGSGESMAFGINETGIVVGRAIPSSNQGHYAFVNIPKIGNINLFNETDPSSRRGWTSFSSAQDITNDGRIVGYGEYAPDGYSNYTSSFILTPIKLNQTITQIALPTHTLKVGQSTSITAKATSRLPVKTTSATPTKCNVVNKILKALSVGTCIITARQAGDVNYNEAKPVKKSISISKGAQTITFNALPATIVKGMSNISASSSSGLKLILASSTPNVCKVKGTIITGIKKGICIVTANQAGNVNYNAATPITRKYAIVK